MATSMDYDSPYKADSPFNYDVEEGELCPGSGRSSPGTIRDNASDCGTQTDDQMGNTDETVTTMRVHLNNTPKNTQTPQEIARKIILINFNNQNKMRIDGIYNHLIITELLLLVNKEQAQIYIVMNITDRLTIKTVQLRNRTYHPHFQITHHQCDRHHHLIML